MGLRVYGKGPTVESETERVESVGGWVGDGRVCDVLAVSRAFGDREFKGSGLKTMLEKGVEYAPMHLPFLRCWRRAFSMPHPFLICL